MTLPIGATVSSALHGRYFTLKATAERFGNTFNLNIGEI